MRPDPDMPVSVEAPSNSRVTDAAPSPPVEPSFDRPSQRPAPSKIAKAWLLLRVFAVAAAVPYLLRCKLERVAHVIEPGTPPTGVEPLQISRIAAYVESAIRYGRPLVRKGCLTRGVTRYYFLRRAGLDVALYFGMGQLDGAFVGHCWLVRDGQPFLEREDTSRYVVMYRISPAGGQPATPGSTTCPAMADS